MHHNEKPIILVVVTFFIALSLVYIAFFRFQVNDTSYTIPDDNSTNSIQTGQNLTLSGSTTGDEQLTLTGISPEYGTGNSIVNTGIIDTNTASSGTRQSRILSLTPSLEPRYGPLKVAPLIGLPIQQVYVGTGGIYYAYLNTGSLDSLAATVRRLGGNVLAIETQNDILGNSLRGDRVLFINIPNITFVRIPTEQRVYVAMIISIGSDRWLIEAPIEIYHTSKSIMKSVFEQLYATKF